MPRTEDFAVFARVVELKSFSLAAESLGVSQPAVSMLVRTLEGVYGAKLIHRGKRRAVPTKVGGLVYETAKHILSTYDASRQKVREVQGAVAGGLSVGCSSIPAAHFLPSIVCRFKKRFCEIAVVVKVGDSNEITRAVANREHELGIVGTTISATNLAFRPIMRDQLVLAAKRGSAFAARKKIAVHELKDIPLLVQQAGSGTSNFLSGILRAHDLSLSDLNVVLEIGLQPSVVAAVREGMGVGVVSRLGMSHELSKNDLTLIEIEDTDCWRDFYLCTERDTPLSPNAERFVEFLTESCRAALL
jgi:DNA-binding transcriptional LysR family regulator